MPPAGRGVLARRPTGGKPPYFTPKGNTYEIHRKIKTSQSRPHKKKHHTAIHRRSNQRRYAIYTGEIKMIVKFTLLNIRSSWADHIIGIVTAIVDALGGDLIVETEIIPQEEPNDNSNSTH